MSTITIGEARAKFSEVVRRAQHGKERIIVARHGRPAAAIISADELDYFERLEDALDIEAAEEALREVERDGALSLDEAASRLDLPRRRLRPAPRRRSR
jgi:prevent-host-death family protein